MCAGIRLPIYLLMTIYSALANQTERRALDARSDFDAVSRLVKLEYARFEQERVEDLKETMERYIEEAIDVQSKVCLSVSPV